MASARARIESLNGWQRLWVVYALLWACAIGSITAMEWEPMPGRPNLIPPLPKGSELIPRTPLKEVDISDLPVPPENWVAAQNTEIAAMAKKRAAQVWDLRQAAILEAASWWAAIVFGTYALGWSVAWVGRGFRRRN